MLWYLLPMAVVACVAHAFYEPSQSNRSKVILGVIAFSLFAGVVSRVTGPGDDATYEQVEAYESETADSLASRMMRNAVLYGLTAAGACAYKDHKQKKE